MQIDQLFDHSPMNTAMPMNAGPVEPLSAANAEASLEGQIFDQLVAQSMSEMQKRQAEIKETLEKSNEE